MRSRKTQCQAPPDNSETGDTYEYHSRERSCAGEKLEHQNVYKRHSSSASTYTSKADFHKPGSTEASEYGVTRGTCFVARRLEVVAVAGPLLISWCVLGRADFSRCFFSLFFSSNAHGLLHEASLLHLPLY